MLGPTGCTRVVQIHPTRRCNLRCEHCYSTSSPAYRGMLDVELLKLAVSDAAAEGYNLVSLSGGEPLLYRHTSELLKHIQQAGLRSALVTNGILLRQRKLEELRESLDLLVISLDGMPESHNQMRGSPVAFESMAARLAAVRASGIPFGFLFTLTQHNLHELPWVVDFADSEGASLLQIHPLELKGVAAFNLAGGVPDAVECAYAWALQAQLAMRLGARLPLQLDLVHTDALQHQRGRVYADGQSIAQDTPLGDVVAPLVIEADGSVVPMAYGFARHYALGNLRDRPLRDLARYWLNSRMPDFQSLCSKTYDDLTTQQPGRFVNWYAELADRAEVEAMKRFSGVKERLESPWSGPSLAVA